MRHFRSRLLVLTLAVVACQVAGLAAVPLVVCVTAASQDTDGAIVCTCSHGANGECPMHQPRKTPRETPRWCSGCDDGLQAVLTLYAVAGVPVEPPHAAAPQTVTTLAIAPLAAARRRAHPPLAPPPKCESTDAS